VLRLGCARRRARIAGMRLLAAGEVGGELHLLVVSVRTQWPLTPLVLSDRDVGPGEWWAPFG
jgi:hypothetical protein